MEITTEVTDGNLIIRVMEGEVELLQHTISLGSILESWEVMKEAERVAQGVEVPVRKKDF